MSIAKKIFYSRELVGGTHPKKNKLGHPATLCQFTYLAGLNKSELQQGFKGLTWSSLFLVKDLDSIGGLLHRRSTLDPRPLDDDPSKLLASRKSRGQGSRAVARPRP
jgi:hypothetical protein